ncbi:MAG: glycoside hydrolase family 26 protein [Bacteroidota bacterium]
MKKYGSFLIVLITFLSCTPNPSKLHTIDELAYPNVSALLNNMHELSKEGVMFGHQDDLAYGVGWSYEPGRSDVAEVTGSLPAVFGWDIGALGLGVEENLDGVPFSKMKEFMIDVYEKGGINTVSWHTYNPITKEDSWADTKEPNPTVSKILPGAEHHAAYVNMLDKVADFFLDLKVGDMEYVPVIFRPFHENNGGWFWWGDIHCTPEDYKMLFQFTVEYLRDKKNVHNLLYSYSPDRGFDTAEEYLERYPGNDYVDIIGNDNYWDFNPNGGGLKAVSKKLEIISNLAKENNKVAAMTETGFESITDTSWYTQRLYKAITDTAFDIRISYVLVWRNFNEKHHYAPYPGHPAAEDFKVFKAKEDIFFLDEIPEMYNKN